MKLIASLSILMLFWANASVASAQNVLFDFNNVSAHTPFPIDVSVSGISAHFTGTGQGFSVQTANTIGLTPSGFDGNCIYPDSVYLADLQIQFSTALSDFSIMYSPEEYACDSSATMRVTAYFNGVKVGTTTTTASVPGTWPTGTLRFTSSQPFNSVVVHYDAAPVTGGDWGPVFMADNMRVSLSNGLVANNDSYSTSVNLPLTVPAGSGVLANDMNASGATAIVVNPPSNGQLDLLQSGGFAYTPNHGYVGVDSFTYVASLNGNQSNTATVKLMVQPLLSNLTVSPTTILGGQALQGTVFLSNPAPTGGSMVSLGSSSSALSVSQGVTISGGATSAVFPISSSSVGAKTPAIISASFFGTTKKVSVTLFPTPKLSSITVTPKSTAGGGTVVIRVTLSAAVPVGSVSISLASDSSALTVPATVSIASGKSNATLSVSCSPVSAPTTANITATLGGAKQTAAVSIQLPKILSLSASPSNLKGGKTGSMTVKLSGKAGSQGDIVALNSSNPAISVPATVIVPSGATSVNFAFTSVAVSKTIAVQVSATLGTSKVISSVIVTK